MASVDVDDPAAQDGSSSARIIILGAGLAGLSCAQDLVTKHGFAEHQIVVLEAADRIGGRIKTDTSFVEGYSLDLGAELIHGDETSLHRMVEENKWETEELISLAQGDGGPEPADSNDGFGLFYVGSEKRMLGMESKDPGYVHLNSFFASLGGMWPSLKQSNKTSTTDNSTAASSSDRVQAPAETSIQAGLVPRCDLASSASDTKGSPKITKSPSLLDGLLQAGVKEPMLGIARAGYANTVGAALEDTGLGGMCFLESEWDVDGDRTFVLKGGLGMVVKALSSDIESCIRMDWPAAKVDYSTLGCVTVTSKDGRQEEGTHVISTLPLSVLQDGDVEFRPPFSERKSRAFEKMGMCSVAKVILKFDRQVLPPLLHGCICSDSFIPEFWFRHIPNTPEGGYTLLAVGFAAGPPADAMSALKPEVAVQKALSQLDDMFGGRTWLEGGGCTGKGDWENHPLPISHSLSRAHAERSSCGQHDGRDGHEEKPVDRTRTEGRSRGVEEATVLPSDGYVGGIVHDWKSEPFIRGGYCFPRLDFDENTHGDAAAPVENRLFFAGEHTNMPTGMTVHAAMDSGERAAQEVADALKMTGKCTQRNSAQVTEDVTAGGRKESCDGPGNGRRCSSTFCTTNSRDTSSITCASSSVERPTSSGVEKSDVLLDKGCAAQRRDLDSQ